MRVSRICTCRRKMVDDKSTKLAHEPRCNNFGELLRSAYRKLSYCRAVRVQETSRKVAASGSDNTKPPWALKIYGAQQFQQRPSHRRCTLPETSAPMQGWQSRWLGTNGRNSSGRIAPYYRKSCEELDNAQMAASLISCRGSTARRRTSKAPLSA